MSCDHLPWAVGDVSEQHRMGYQEGLGLGVIYYICINPRRINCISGLGLQFFRPLVCAVAGQ